MTVALLDADIVAYRAAAAAESNIDWGDGEEGKTVSASEARTAALFLANEWARKAGAHSAICCFSVKDSNTFRKHLYPAYKAHRRGGKPEAYQAAVEILEENFKTIRIDGMEADDVLGILATNGRVTQPVIITIDKDLQQIPGLIFNPTKDRRPRKLTVAQCEYFWMYQTLIGDSSDGYKGCPGIGPAKAKAVLDDNYGNLGAMWREVVTLFESKGLTDADALLQARLAKILTNADYDSNTKRIHLWAPNPSSKRSLSLPLPQLPSTAPSPEAVSPKSPASSVKNKDSKRSNSRGRSKR